MENAMDERLLEYLSILRDFGRIYTQKILDGSPEGKIDLKLSQIKALYAFRDNDCLSMKELANNIGVKLPNMTMMVDNLAEEGIVERERDARDRRKVNVWLTPKGKQVRADFLAHRAKIANSIFAVLKADERQELVHSLGSVCRILEKAFEQDLR